jgi:hypothetical protein
MDEHKFRDLFETARRIGEEHSRRAIASAVEVRNLRVAIWRALSLLRKGQIDQARLVLENVMKHQA